MTIGLNNYLVGYTIEPICDLMSKKMSSLLDDFDIYGLDLKKLKILFLWQKLPRKIHKMIVIYNLFFGVEFLRIGFRESQRISSREKIPSIEFHVLKLLIDEVHFQISVVECAQSCAVIVIMANPSKFFVIRTRFSIFITLLVFWPSWLSSYFVLF